MKQAEGMIIGALEMFRAFQNVELLYIFIHCQNVIDTPAPYVQVHVGASVRTVGFS